MKKRNIRKQQMLSKHTTTTTTIAPSTMKTEYSNSAFGGSQTPLNNNNNGNGNSSNTNISNDNKQDTRNNARESALSHLVAAAGMRSSQAADSNSTGNNVASSGNNCSFGPVQIFSRTQQQDNEYMRQAQQRQLKQHQQPPPQQPHQQQQQQQQQQNPAYPNHLNGIQQAPPQQQTQQQQQIPNNRLGGTGFGISALQQQLVNLTPDFAQNLSAAQLQSLQSLLSSQQSPPAVPKPAAVPQTQNGLQPADILALARSIPGLSDLAGMGMGESPLDLIQRLGMQSLLRQPQQQQQQQLADSQQSSNQTSNLVTSSAQENRTDYAFNESNSSQANGTIQVPPNSIGMSTNNLTKESGGGSNGTPNVPGTIILPCRARGMPVDHNFRTAHFVIPGNVGHGEDLICSYSACRNAGVKFRYCASCRVPVAKRNFHQRHGHGIPTTREENQNNKSSSTPKRPPSGTALPDPSQCDKNNSKVNKKQPPTQTVDVRRNSSVDEDTETNFRSPGELPRQMQDGFETSLSRNKHDRSVSNQKVSSSDPSGTSTSTSKSTSVEVPHARQMQWAALLRRRPDTSDSDSMSAWLLEVMAVSDLKAPLKTQGTSSLTTSNSSSDISSDTNEPTSSLNSFTSTDCNLSSDTSTLEQAIRRSDVKKSRGQKRRLPDPESRSNQQPEGATPPRVATARREEEERGQEKKRRKKRQRAFESDEAERKKQKHRSAQKYKPSLSKNYENGLSTSKRHSETKERKPEKKQEKIGGNYAEWRERKKQKALLKKRAATLGKSSQL